MKYDKSYILYREKKRLTLYIKRHQELLDNKEYQ